MTEHKKLKKTIDPYTGEKTLEAEDAGNVTEIMPVDPGDRQGKNYLLTEETSMDMLAADADADVVAQKSARFTDNEGVEEVFEERQRLAVGGREALEGELDEYNSQSPELTGGDLDASWQSANTAGEEAVGGTVPTPGQNVVGKLGDAVGLTYEADEPLASEEKLLQRDRQRFELSPEADDTVTNYENPNKQSGKE